VKIKPFSAPSRRWGSSGHLQYFTEEEENESRDSLPSKSCEIELGPELSFPGEFASNYSFPLTPNEYGVGIDVGVQSFLAATIPQTPPEFSDDSGHQPSGAAITSPALADFSHCPRNPSLSTGGVTHEFTDTSHHLAEVNANPFNYIPYGSSIAAQSRQPQDALSDSPLEFDSYGNSYTPNPGSNFDGTGSLEALCKTNWSQVTVRDPNRTRVETAARHGVPSEHIAELGKDRETAPISPILERHLFDQNFAQPSIDYTSQFEHKVYRDLVEGPIPQDSDSTTSSPSDHARDTQARVPDAKFHCARCPKQYLRRHKLKYVCSINFTATFTFGF